MYKATELEKIFQEMIEVEFDLSCYLNVITELEEYYDMENKREMSERVHFMKITLDQISEKMNSCLLKMDEYLVKNK